MKLYPIFANIEGKTAVIVGGGEVAFRKLKDILESGAMIKIISPEIHKSIDALAKENPSSIKIVIREYSYGDIEGAFIAFAATNKTEINRSIFLEAQERGILINSADDPANCSFFLPSFSRTGSLLLAVSTSGDSPAMAAKLRRIFEKSIPENIETVLSALHNVRDILKNKKHLSSSERSQILKKIINDDNLIEELLQQKEKGQIEEMIEKMI